MKKIDRLKAELRQAVAFFIILTAITAASAHFLAIAWMDHSLISFFISGIFTGCFGWLALMQALTVIHDWQKVGREQLRMDLEEANIRFDIKF